MKGKILIFVLLLFTVVFFIFANAYSNNKIKAQGERAYEDSKKQQKIDEQKKQHEIALLKENKSHSVEDWLKYESTLKDTITMDVLGSSVTHGDGSTDGKHGWADLLANYLPTSGISSINLINNGYPGFSTQGLINEHKTADVIKNNPDIVIFELCLLNNTGQNVTLEQTYKDIDTIVSDLKKNLPNSLIVLQSADSIPNDKPNKINLTYDDYNQKVKQYVQSKGYNFIDTFDQFQKYVSDNKVDYKNILKDGIHPNDQGYQIWFNILKDNLGKTSAN